MVLRLWGVIVGFRVSGCKVFGFRGLQGVEGFMASGFRAPVPLRDPFRSP